MQAMKRSDLPPDAQKQLEGYNFCILSAGKWPKVLDKDNDSVALGVRFKGIDTHRKGFCSETGAAKNIAKTQAELSAEIGNVDRPGFEMYRIDE